MMGVPGARPTALLAAAGAGWEADAVAALGSARVVVAKRCVDVTDLLATAATGVADVAVVAAELPGLDADAVRRLAQARLGVVAVADGALVERARRLGLAEVLLDPDAAEIAAAVVALATRTQPAQAVAPAPAPSVAPDPDGGRIIAVWGPHGAPGRTTLATALAAEWAVGGRRVVLVDADPYGGAVGQNLGVLDEVSGLLAAARHLNEGTLTPESLSRCRRRLDSGLEVLTGLPRPDRWPEVRPGALARVLETAALHADVVVDVGFGLGEERHGGPDRITLEALDAAAEVVAIGGAEPVGLVRLARGLVDLGERGTVPRQVVVNRMRDSLGWTRKDLAAMVTGYVWDAQVHFVRDDRDTADRALAAGRSVTELGESRLRTDLAAVAAAVLGS